MLAAAVRLGQQNPRRQEADVSRSAVSRLETAMHVAFGLIVVGSLVIKSTITCWMIAFIWMMSS